MLVIKNIKIYTSAGAVLNQGHIIIDAGKILQVGEEIPIPKEAEVIEGKGLTAIPGIVDAHTHAGCRESLTGSCHDANEISSPINPELDVYYSIDADSQAFDDARRNGVTTLSVLPGSAVVIGGMCCVLKCRRGSTKQMCLVRESALKASLGSGPRSIFGKRGLAPVTMMGQIQQIRDVFGKGRAYAEKKKQAAAGKGQAPIYDRGMENLCRVLNREIPLRIHVESHNILNALRLARELDVSLVLEHAFGFSHYIEEIAAAGNLTGVVLGPTFYSSLPGIAQDTSVSRGMELVDRGVCTAIMTDYFPETNFGTLLLQAGEIVRRGAAIEDVLRMLTINPARILGVDDRVGSIEKGKDADIVLFEGTPLADGAAKIRYTLINGEIVYQNNTF